MNVKHNPLFDTERVANFYSEKDGVEINYVCTSSVTEHGCNAYDIFYRETPHPEFGNRYFGLGWGMTLPFDGAPDGARKIVITNADNIENMEICAIRDNEKGLWVYSRHRHDVQSCGNTMIDGGRSYQRLVGDIKTVERKTFKIKNGTFVEETENG